MKTALVSVKVDITLEIEEPEELTGQRLYDYIESTAHQYTRHSLCDWEDIIDFHIRKPETNIHLSEEVNG